MDKGRSSRASGGAGAGADFVLPPPYLRAIAEGVRVAGGDVTRWLRRGGLSEAALASGELELGPEQFEALIADAYAMTGEPALGLLVGQQLVLASHGMVGFAALSSRTVREGLELIARFTALRTSMVSMGLEAAPGGPRLRLRERHLPAALARPILEALVFSIHRELGPFSGGACLARRVAFAFEAPAYADLARRLFGCEVRYGASWNGLELPEASLDAPLRTADPEALRETARLCEQELEARTARASVSSRVRQVLLDQASGPPSLRATARALHLTPRTLHRRLRAEGGSYGAILDDVRHALALEHLRAGRLSVKAVALGLGYSDVANFRRAFKRWEAVPPSAVRRPAPARA